MFFILSKTVGYLVMPLTILMGCLVVSRIVKQERWRKRFLSTGLILLFIFSNEFIANELMK